MKLSSVNELLPYIQAHRAWGRTIPGRAAGFTLPVFGRGRLFVLEGGGNTEALERRGVRLAAPFQAGRLHVWIGDSVRDLDVVIEAEPDTTGLIVLDGPGRIDFQVDIRAQDHVLIMSGSEHLRQGRANLWGTATAAFFGAGGSSNYVTFMAEGDGVSTQVGDDAMFSEDVEIVTTDNHGIFEIADPSRLINLPESVVIHPHVWAGRSVTVSKGVSVGPGAILGRRSLVTRDVGKACAVAGTPARVLREGVSWIRPWFHDRPSIDAALAMIDPPPPPPPPRTFSLLAGTQRII